VFTSVTDAPAGAATRPKMLPVALDCAMAGDDAAAAITAPLNARVRARTIIVFLIITFLVFQIVKCGMVALQGTLVLPCAKVE
jgi:hypothetical protein